MSRKILLAAFAVLTLSPLPLCSQQTAAEQWDRIYAANNLDNEGSRPFHLVVAYQLYDLSGNPGEKGTVEEWWASAKSHHVVITGSSFPPADSPEKAGPAGPGQVRESFLVHMLVDAIVRPVPKVDLRPKDKADDDAQQFGKISLRCLHLQSPTAPLFRYACTEAGSDVVRVMKSSQGDEAITRNGIGKFHDVTIATKVSLGLNGKTAITGDITTLETIDVGQHAEVLDMPEPPAKLPQPGAGSVGAPGVKPGKLLIRAQPVYPPAAKVRFLEGSVLLAAVISKTGDIRQLIPIGASDPMFIPAAMEAVQKWKYEPCLLNGEPTEVDTTITVNFTITR